MVQDCNALVITTLVNSVMEILLIEEILLIQCGAIYMMLTLGPAGFTTKT